MRERRICVRCNEVKALELFVGDSRLPSGYRKYCKECKNKAFRARYEGEKDLKERVRFQQKVYWDGRTDKRHLVYGYGLTAESFDKMLARQSGRCAICIREFTDQLKPCVDHDHSCCEDRRKTCGLCTRGLLCVPCNGKLGIIEDAAWVSAATQYLDGWQ